MRHSVGFHIRYDKSPFEVLERAERLNLRIAQAFMHNENGIALHLNEADRKQFIKQRNQVLDIFIAHGSYKINCADQTRTYHPALEHELQLANSLLCTHIVLHAGATPDFEKGIDALARLINKFCKQQYGLRLALENTAFATPSIGGDINHFAKILEKIDKPEQLSFCIDTAHAHAAGYDLVHKQNDFIRLLATKIGIERIALIHLNDTPVERGSHIDLHGQLGQGTIGIDALRSFTSNSQLKNIPLILELPVMAEPAEQETIDLVNSWFKE